MRDWSQDGAPERTQSYGRICQEAQKQLAGRNPDDPAKILVPGMIHRLSRSLASLHKLRNCASVGCERKMALFASCVWQAYNLQLCCSC